MVSVQNFSKHHEGRAKPWVLWGAQLGEAALSAGLHITWHRANTRSSKQASMKLNLCNERRKTELIRQHKMLPLGTHKAKN